MAPLLDALLVSRPLALAKDELLDLARRRLGKLADLDVLRRFEARDPVLAEVDQLVLRDRAAGPRGDEGLRDFAPLLVGDADYADLEPRRGAP